MTAHDTDPRYCIVLINGNQEWRNQDGQLDSWQDRPAVIWSSDPGRSSPNTAFWYKNGTRHRDNDLPARVEPSGYQEWWHEGQPSRPSGGPNVLHEDGTCEWTNTQLQPHRDNDLPAVVKANGTQVWFVNGVQHRDGDNPAFISGDGLSLRYFKDGKLHRENGPALIDRDGTRIWYLDGQERTEAEVAALQAKKTSSQNKPGPKP